MQKLVIEEPYRFIPPYRGRFWSQAFRALLPTYLQASHGIIGVECRGLEAFQASVRAGKGVLLAPNHCRLSDPMTAGWIVRKTGIDLFTMASWHLFKQDRLFDRLSAWMMRRLGAFSIFREGADRAALANAVEILTKAERPLVLFPEGVVSRSNDRLGPLMDGVAFIARMAAKKAAKEGKPGVVVHPVAIRYVFLDDAERAVEPFLADLEKRLTWRRHRERPVLERVSELGLALLALKEIEYTGRAGQGTLHERRRALIERILRPLEEEWIATPSSGSVVARVKDLRSALLPELLKSDLPAAERDRMRGQLDDASLAQALNFYPEGYLTPDSPPEHLIETVERIEEELTGTIRVYGRFKVVLDIGEAIPVSPEREKKVARGEPDPLLEQIGSRLKELLAVSAEEVAASRRTTAPPPAIEQPERIAAGV